MSKVHVEIILCDFDDEAHTNALIRLMNMYITDKMGGGEPLDKATSHRLVEGLKAHPSKLVLLAKSGQNYVGLSNCFINFGTFNAKPFINIHDIVVDPVYRGLGVGEKLMMAIDKHAAELGCGKITLEVRYDNDIAQNLYHKMGYGECSPPMHF